MTHYFIVPGLGNSGEEHWQTHFERSGGNFFRINQKDWESPDCNDWVETLDKALLSYDLSSVILVGHSLGCLTIVHWVKKYHKKVKGALLVAPADIEKTESTLSITGFTPIPLDKLDFKTIVVASSNDPWAALERSEYFASHWGSEFVNIGRAGHISASSGYGPWMEGRELLKILDS